MPIGYAVYPGIRNPSSAMRMYVRHTPVMNEAGTAVIKDAKGFLCVLIRYSVETQSAIIARD